MMRTGEQYNAEEAFSAKTISAILTMLEGQPTRVALGVLGRVGDLIKDIAQESPVNARASLDYDTSGIIRWWLAKEEAGQLGDGL